MSLKRRSLISLGLGGLALAVGRGCLPTWSQQSTPLSPISTVGLVETEEPLRFMAIGDVGTGSPEQYAVAQAMMQRQQIAPSPFALLAGDNIYDRGEIGKIHQVFEQPYAELLTQGVKFYAALGNHDVGTNNGEDEVAYPGYNMSGRYYTFTQQSVQFFALDTNQAITRGAESLWAEQLQWLRTELQRSRQLWKVVFAHHPVYSSGQHGSTAILIEDLPPIFADYDVRLYINGHDHNYERTVPIDGTTYITTGNGALLRPVGSSDWTAYASSQLGYTAFEVYSDRFVIQAIDSNNQIYDEASIVSA
ncbi:metallophosphoesterase [Nodosilinea sp. LEGE 07088]|nr:metallophosphoesterase [Nodosilinea sp. LEGE 07088]